MLDATTLTDETELTLPNEHNQAVTIDAEPIGDTVAEGWELIEDEKIDPHVNEQGIYIRGVEEIRIPIRAESKTTAAVFVTKTLWHTWRAAWVTERTKCADASQAGGVIDVTGDEYASSKEAIAAMLEELVTYWTSQSVQHDGQKAAERRDAIVLEDLENFERAFQRIGWNPDGPRPSAEAVPMDAPDEAEAAPTEAAETRPATAPAAEKSPEEIFETRKSRLEGELADAAVYEFECGEALKAAREIRKEVVTELRKHLANGPERLPLFDDQPKPGKATGEPMEEAAEATADPSEPVASTAPPEDTNWRLVTTEELGIPKGICQILRECPERSITTRGDIADWTATDRPLTAIPRIGEAKSETILQACIKYDAEEHPLPQRGD